MYKDKAVFSNFSISNDKKNLDIPLIFDFLSNSYWAKNRTIDEVKTSIENSLCYGLFEENKQVGFGRIVTDKTVFSYLMDFFIMPQYQKKGLGKYFFEQIYEHEDLIEVETHYLITGDAQNFYKKLDFKIYPFGERFMFKKKI